MQIHRFEGQICRIYWIHFLINAYLCPVFDVENVGKDLKNEKTKKRICVLCFPVITSGLQDKTKAKCCIQGASKADLQIWLPILDLVLHSSPPHLNNLCWTKPQGGDPFCSPSALEFVSHTKGPIYGKKIKKKTWLTFCRRKKKNLRFIAVVEPFLIPTPHAL